MGVGGICPIGHECPEGSPTASPCKQGFYANTTKMAACDPCPPGKELSDDIVDIDCDNGNAGS